MLFAGVMATVTSGTVAHFPSSETVAYLNSVLNEEEKEMLIAWGAAPDLPTDTEIGIIILEGMHADPRVSLETLHARIRSTYPAYADSVGTVGVAKYALLNKFVRPPWFHKALLEWPGPITTITGALVDHLERARPTDAPPRYFTREGLVISAAEWEELCLSHLRAGKAVCGPHQLRANGVWGTWIVLSSDVIHDQIRRLLQKLRAVGGA